ncbi:MAG: 5-formyltetrahydrofolate cyclo-ligase [Lentisphaeraceae bacterium]|nr:5-formyltetrahydrofolate cyclo-ligase [Lentisphaeraceae bacterium]
MVIDSKTALRDKVRDRKATSEQVINIEAKISTWEIYQQSTAVAFYIAMKDELKLEFIFNSGKKLFLPRYNSANKTYSMVAVRAKEQLVEGKYGILEPGKDCSPAEKNEIELWFIPGMAFTRSGDRLGRGAGFYDRLLEGETGIKTGICTSDRILENIPGEVHDIKMNFVLTDKEIIKIN